MMVSQPFDWREFLMLSAAGVFGVIAAIPYFMTVQGVTLKAPSRAFVIIFLQVTQQTILVVIAVAVGLLLGSRMELGAPLIQKSLTGESIWGNLKAILGPSMIFGAIVSLIIAAFEKAIFASRMPKLSGGPLVPIWQAVLASLYGGITEELLMRLGLLTVLAWLLGNISYTAQGLPSDAAICTAIIITAIAFGLGHLPATAALIPLTPAVVIRALALNGLAGLVFGYLYWAWGLESAIFSHFTADIVLHLMIAPSSK
jgi:membrane protease YdiL (CAAX protease family)